MSAYISVDHPELVGGPGNPLLENLSPFIPLDQFPPRLMCEPLKGIPWRKIAPRSRVPLLSAHQQSHFFPTTAAIEIASAMQEAMRASLFLRNPLAAAEQKRINQLIRLDAEELSLPVIQSIAIPASGGLLAAETGYGKSTTIKHVIELIAPQQVIVHGPSAACGWSRLIQVTYLLVELPTNGSRGGLLSRILGALDAAALTDWGKQLERCKNLDHKIVLTFKALSIHRVALVVLDESQADTLENNEWNGEYVRFFLALLNLGIPLLLSGHPSAFRTMRRNGQLSRRFSTIGCFDLRRAKPGDPWWNDTYGRGVMAFNLCEKIEDEEAIRLASRDATAGVPGYLTLLWLEMQRIALNRAADEAVITYADIAAAQASRRFEGPRKMVAWLESDEPTQSFDDLTRHKPLTSTASETIAVTARAGRQIDRDMEVVKVIDGLRRKAKSDATRRSKKAEADRILLETLDPEDLRKAGRTVELLAGLEDAQQKLL